jgi:hypothetical protein
MLSSALPTVRGPPPVNEDETDENAADGILVVQVYRLGQVP